MTLPRTLLVLSSLALAACQSDDVAGPPDTLDLTAETKQSHTNHRVFAATDVLTFSDETAVGRSRLSRSRRGIWTQTNTTRLAAKEAYTLWWIIFDDPEHCSPPACGADDVFEDALAGGPNLSEVTILGPAAGRVASRSGRARFAGRLLVNDVSKVIFGDGLQNPAGAEVHLIVRTHGPALPDLLREQLTTLNGGCNPGEPNEGRCEDVQFAVHLP